MKKNLKRLAMFGCIVYTCALNAQNEVATPLFSVDVKDAVSMYCDENAETFYLHTSTANNEGIKYTVSRDGKILAEEPSWPMWACWDDGVMYTHVAGDRFILNQAGDTILKADSRFMATAQPMSYKNGVFYWWSGPKIAHTKSSGIFSYKEGNDALVPKTFHYLHCTGIVVMDDIVLCTSYNTSHVGFYTLYFNDESEEWEPQTPQELPGVKGPVGLSLVGDTFYIWSIETQTMYTIPKSFFSGSGFTGVQASTVNADKESAVIYDLQGRPADETQKGIYVRNGKKVLVR